jgi:hypothetical protein
MKSFDNGLKYRLALGSAAVLALTAAGPDSFDVRTQIGPNPVLPEPQQYLSCLRTFLSRFPR